MQKLLFLIVSILLLTVGLAVALALPNLPMFGDWPWFVVALFLVLGIAALRRRFSLSYLVLAVPVALLLAHALTSLIWPAADSDRSGIDTVENGAMESALPLATETVRGGPGTVRGRSLQVPEDWTVSVFASGLGQARMLATTADGTLLVSSPDRGEILALPDGNGDGIADRTVVFAGNLPSVHGLARLDDVVWAAQTGRLLQLPDRDGDLRADEVVVQSRDLPEGGGHWTRSLAVSRSDKEGPTIFLSAGSSCNACLEEDPRRAAVMTFSPESSSGSIFATGLRNSVGLALHPQTGELWGSDNGRDMLGDDLPPDEINLIREGGDYGWPTCYGDRIPDPKLGSPQHCRDTVPSRVDLQAHSAPLGITFVPGGLFGHQADHLLLVAYHGSWNRTIPTGYKLVAIPFADGLPAGPPFDLVRGWLVDGEAWGRPVAPQLGQDGALYLSDDLRGVVYRFAPKDPSRPARAGAPGN